MEQDGVLDIARLICVAARTAPKARGIDDLETLVLTDGEKDALADKMEQMGKTAEVPFFIRDAGNMREADAAVLLGMTNKRRGVPNCGLCGYADCKANREANGLCALSITDLGIAVGSAVSKAADLRADNRILFTAGRGAVELSLFAAAADSPAAGQTAEQEGPVVIAYGIPLKVAGKNPFFDRVKK